MKCSKCGLDKADFWKSDTVCKDCRKSYHVANKDKSRVRQTRYQERQKLKRKWKEIPLETQKSIQLFARQYAAKHGFPNLSDEYAQDILEARLRGVNRKNAHIWVELMRKQFGRTYNGSGGKNGSRVWQSLDDLVVEDKPYDDSLNDVIAFLNKNYPEPLSTRRISFLLWLNHELTCEEIGSIFMVSGGRIQQLIKEVNAALKKYLLVSAL